MAHPHTAQKSANDRPRIVGRLYAVAGLLLVGMAAAGSASAQALPDLGLGVDQDIRTPYGGASAHAQGTQVKACADADVDANDVADVSSLPLPALPLPALPVAVPAVPDLPGATASTCIEQDASNVTGLAEKTLANATDGIDDPTGKAGGVLDNVKDAFDGAWDAIRGIF